MDVIIRKYNKNDLKEMIEIWNEVVLDGIAFPQTEPLNIETAEIFFSSQSFTGVAEKDGEILGLYILHPNNIGRCGHISNSSYAVSSKARGMKIGKKLVLHSIETARKLGFKILQFNAVVNSNIIAIKLYEKLGFHKIGIVPGGFLNKDNIYEDITLFYYEL